MGLESILIALVVSGVFYLADRHRAWLVIPDDRASGSDFVASGVILLPQSGRHQDPPEGGS